MTYEQTREQFVLAWNSNAYLNMCESSDMENAINALEKQIPRRPLPYKGFDGKCVCCGVIFLDRSTKHCGNCGQALDWSDTE